MEELIARSRIQTALMRRDPAPRWERLRRKIVDEGLDPEVVALADLFPDDTARETGVLVTLESRAFEFVFELDIEAPDFETQYDNSRVIAWMEVTSASDRFAHQVAIQAGKQILMDQK